MDAQQVPGLDTFLHYLSAGGSAPLYFLAYIGWRFHKRLERIETKLFGESKNETAL